MGIRCLLVHRKDRSKFYVLIKSIIMKKSTHYKFSDFLQAFNRQKSHCSWAMLLLVACFTILPATSGYAQTTTITGTVVDAADNSLLPGVNVIEKGTSNGTIT